MNVETNKLNNITISDFPQAVRGALVLKIMAVVGPILSAITMILYASDVTSFALTLITASSLLVFTIHTLGTYFLSNHTDQLAIVKKLIEEKNALATTIETYENESSIIGKSNTPQIEFLQKIHELTQLLEEKEIEKRNFQDAMEQHSAELKNELKKSHTDSQIQLKKLQEQNQRILDELNQKEASLNTIIATQKSDLNQLKTIILEKENLFISLQNDLKKQKETTETILQQSEVEKLNLLNSITIQNTTFLESHTDSQILLKKFHEKNQSILDELTQSQLTILELKSTILEKENLVINLQKALKTQNDEIESIKNNG